MTTEILKAQVKVVCDHCGASQLVAGDKETAQKPDEWLILVTPKSGRLTPDDWYRHLCSWECVHGYSEAR